MVRLNGTLKLEIIRNGQVVTSLVQPNLITNAGLNLMAGLLGGQTARPLYVAFGDDNTTPTVDDTALSNEIGTRVSVTPTASGNICQFAASFTADAKLVDVCEVGMLTASTEGVLFNRTISEKFTVAIGDVLNLGWTIEIGE